MFKQDFTCPALLEDALIFYLYGTITHFGADFHHASSYYKSTIGLVRFRSPLLSESRLISFPQGTEMFHFPWFASYTYVFSARYPLRMGSPIQKSLDQSLFAAPQRLSQRITSFIASNRQGIH